MSDISNKKLTPNAQKLRKNMTKEERKLWYGCLKRLPVVVRRQKVIGPYIVDFYCAEAKIVIELDAERDSYLNGLGMTVLRYSNADVDLRFESVCQDIWNRICEET